jgi:hypothetical protein
MGALKYGGREVVLDAQGVQLVGDGALAPTLELVAGEAQAVGPVGSLQVLSDPDINAMMRILDEALFRSEVPEVLALALYEVGVGWLLSPEFSSFRVVLDEPLEGAFLGRGAFVVVHGIT